MNVFVKMREKFHIIIVNKIKKYINPFKVIYLPWIIHRVLLSYKKLFILLYCFFAPTFAKVEGQFFNLKDQRSAEKKVLHSQLKDHRFHLRKLL